MGSRQPSPEAKAQTRLQSLAGNFVQPPASIIEPRAQQQSRLLMTILVCIFLSNLLVLVLQLLAGNPGENTFSILLGLPPLLIGLYGIARRGYTQWAAAGLVTLLFILFSISPLALAQLQHTEFFIVLPMLLSGIYFSFNTTLLVTALAVIIPLAMELVMPSADIDAVLERMLFTVPTGIMLLVYIRHQATLYKLQQSELLTAYDQLKESESLLEQRVEARTRELQHSERSLQEAESRFHSLFDQTHDAVGILDFEGRMIGANRRAAEMLGYTPEEMQRITVRETSAQSADSLAAIHRLLTGEHVPPYIRMFRHKDGHTFPVEVQLELVRDLNGNPLHVQSVARDVSSQQELEDQLRLQGAALAATANAVMITSKDGVIVWINPAYATLTGYTLDEAKGKNSRDLVKSDIQDEAFYKQMWDTILHGENWHGTLVNRRKDGSLYTEEQNITPLRDRNGEISHFIAIKQDITEREKAAIALREAQHHYYSLFEQAHDAVFILDLEAKHIRVNQRASDMLGYTRDELVAMGVNDISAEQPQSMNIRERLLAGERFPVYERNFRHKEGRLIPVEINLELVRDSAGQPMYIQSVVRDISDRKQVESQIRLQSAALAATSNAVLITDKEGIVEWCNPAYTTLTGHTPETIIGKNYLDLLLSDQVDVEFAHRMWDTVLSGQNWQGTFVNRRKDGSTYPEEQTITPVRGVDGTISHFVAIKQDISERQKAESALRESETRYRLITENITDIITKFTPDGARTFVSPSCFNLLGYTPDEFLARKVYEDVHPDDVANSTQALIQAVENNLPYFTVTHRLRHKDGHYVWCEVNSTVVREPSTGKVREILAILHDVSERKQAEDALRESEARYQSVVQSQNELICRYAPDLTITFVNSAYCRYFNKTQEALIGHNFMEFVPEARRETIQQNIQQLIASRGTSTYEHEVIVGDGSTRWQMWTDTVIVDSNGEPTALQRVGVDITDRKSAEIALRKSEARLNNILDSMQEAVWSVELPDFKPAYFNAAVEHVFGRPRNEFYESDGQWWRLVYQPDAHVLSEMLKEAQESGRSNHELRVMHPNGELRWIDLQMWLVRDQDGNVVGMEGMASDITARKQMEIVQQSFLDDMRALQSIHLELSRINQIDLLYKQMVMLPRERLGFERFALFILNDKEQEISGTYGVDTSGELRDESYYRETVTPDHWTLDVLNMPDHVRFWDQAPLNDNGMTVGKGWKAGAALWNGQRSLGYLVTDNIVTARSARPYEAELISVLGSIFGHLVERKRAEESLQRSEARLNNILDSMQEAVWSVELPDFTPVYFNAAVERVFGRSRDMFYRTEGMWGRLVHPGDTGLFQQMISETRRTGRSAHELRLLHPNGDVRWIHGQMWLVRNKDGQPVGLEGMAGDITMRKEVETVQQSFLDDMRALQRIHLELSRIEDLETLYKQMIVMTRVWLGLERVGVFALNEAGDELSGTYGVDTNGDMRDEHYYREPITERHWTMEVLNTPDHVRFWNDAPLNDNGISVGKGWKAGTALWNGQKALGYLVTDNFVNQRPPRPYEIELISVLGSIFGHLLERKRAEAALRQSESRQRAMIQAIPDLIFRLRKDGTFVDYHAPNANLLFASPEAFIGKTINDVFPPAIAQQHLDMAHKTMETGQISTYQFEMPVNDQKYRFEVRSVPIDNDELLSISRDVTELWRAQHELETAKSRLEFTVDTARIAWWEMNLHTGKVWFDPRRTQMIGHTSAALENANYKDWTDLMHPQDCEQAAAALADLLTGRKSSYAVDYRIRSANNEWVWFHDWGEVGRTADGDQVARGFVMDITERKRAEQHLFDLALERERVGLLRDFIEKASHEFRTPLSVISSSAYLMSRTNDQERRMKRADLISEQVKLTTHLLDMLLVMSRLESDLTTRFSLVNLDIPFETTFQNLHSNYGEKPQITYERLSDLPMVMGNSADLAEAFTQVIDNAYRYTPPDGTIHLSSEVRGDEVWFIIRDTGPGISDEVLPHIFETFWRLDEAHTTPGFGLGLPIARRIVQMHGGRIEVKSEVNVGSTFYIILPLPPKEILLDVKT